MLKPIHLHKVYNKKDIYVAPIEIFSKKDTLYVFFWYFKGDPLVPWNRMLWKHLEEPVETFTYHYWQEVFLDPELVPQSGKEIPF